MRCAPYVPSDPKIVRRMLEIAEVGPGDVVYDLGCGDGRILFMAIEEFHAERAVGFEISGYLHERLTREVARRGLQGRVEVVHGDLFDADISEATIITLYLTDKGNRLLKPKLMREAQPGTRIVSHNFDMPGWEPAKLEVLHWELYNPKIYLFKTP